MRHLFLFLFLVVFLLNCKSSGSGENFSNNEDWIFLFDGSNFSQWRGFHMENFPDSGWYIENHVLHNDGSGAGGLVTKEQYSSFILEWEWCLYDSGGNSGVKYFVKERPDKESNYAFGLEYQMLDDMNHAWMKEGKMTINDYHTTGALYEFFAPSEDKKLMPLGQFNTSKIVVKGNDVEHWLNGIKILEYERGGEKFLEMKAKSKFKDQPEFGQHKEGYILLQDHQSRVGFRNIRIKILNP
jgi:hypothetical protein